MMNRFRQTGVSRRRFSQGVAGFLALAGLPLTGRTSTDSLPPSVPELSGTDIELSLTLQPVNITGRQRQATLINQCLPGPLLRLKEGQQVRLTVYNHLPVDSSLHWHGLLVPSDMDGVPGLSFDGIKPGGHYQYVFTLKQSGTYWYHSHSGYQEQTGLYGAIIIEPLQPEPFQVQRDYVLLLSDWSDETPQAIEAKLKKNSHYYAVNQRNVGHFFREARQKGFFTALNERAMWNNMRMSDRDIADVTGKTYHLLMNGLAQQSAWRGHFQRGETVRLRLINASAMTFFDVHIPDVRMTVVAADGQPVQAVDVDELRIGNGETYDVLVTPQQSCTIFAQAMDRSTWIHGFLVDETGQLSLIPEMDSMPELQHRDMGMAHEAAAAPAMHDHSMHHHAATAPALGNGAAGFGSMLPVVHKATELSPHVDMLAENPQYRLDDPGPGLRHHQHLLNRRVLTYADLRNRYPVQDKRPPSREIQLHLTGNMHRYLWSIDGISHHDAEPIILRHGERVRVTLVNDTMMSHPMHLHGLWSELETGDGVFIPKKHTVIVQPGSKISFLVTADAVGQWAFHCHLLYHMKGMMRTVEVVA